jgi:hypothetical protein
MRWLTMVFSAAALCLGAASLSTTAQAEPTNQGPKVCSECHKGEHAVWEGTKHSQSFKEIHKSPKAKDIIAAVGGEKNMKKNAVCTQCHYTLIGADKKAEAGPSCESCHGSSSDWFKIHNDFGGPTVKREDEAADHKKARYENAAKAGMLWPWDRYGIAENCTECHGLANPKVPADALAKMLDAGHPAIAEWELIQYSQGTVRHRFYPPNMTTNAEMTPAEAARMFVTGQAAKLVSAAGAIGKVDSAKYKEFQQKRIDLAKAALAKVPDAKALIDAPSVANARELVAAIADKDLSGAVGGDLPAKNTYK